MSDLSVSVRDFFSVMRFIGLLFFVPVVVSLLSFELEFAPGFISIGVLVFLVSHIAMKLMGNSKETEFRHALVTVVMVWMVTCLLGSFPFAYYHGMNIEDAIFESVSAWTTTGFTMIDHTSAVPVTLLFWRSFNWS